MSEINDGKVRIYGCGGLGVNITSYFAETNKEPNCAELLPSYIDTSRSNLKFDYKDEDVFILPNVDGSGKVRSENHEEIANVIKQILLKIEPTSFNIVVFSASGGSGSVIGPLIMSELLERGLSTVCLVVGSDESIITAKNTVNTLKSLDAIARLVDLPVVMYYDHNDRKRSEVNKSVQLAIGALAVLASSQNDELDSKDVENWVQFSKTTVVEPQLALLEIFSETKDVEAIEDPISIASIYADKDAAHAKAISEYMTVGYLETAAESFNQLHYVISIDAIPKIAETITNTLNKYNTQRDSRVKQTSVSSTSDNVTSKGIVL